MPKKEFHNCLYVRMSECVALLHFRTNMNDARIQQKHRWRAGKASHVISISMHTTKNDTQSDTQTVFALVKLFFWHDFWCAPDCKAATSKKHDPTNSFCHFEIHSKIVVRSTITF